MTDMVDPLFGIAKLDGELGGFPTHKSVIFSASPAVGNEAFGYQIVANNEKDNKILIFLNRTSPPAYFKEMEEFHFPVSKNIFVLDAYSNLTGIESSGSANVIVIKNPNDKEEILRTLGAELEKGYTLVLFDSFSLVVDTFGFDYAISIIAMLREKINKSETAAALLFTDWGYGENERAGLMNLTDAEVVIRGIEKRGIFGQYSGVIKCKWLPGKSFTSTLFKVVKPGGIKIAIPKILVTGPTDAGKSSFIHSASKNAVSVDKLGGTIALDHGSVDFKGYLADLFGTPGQERFDPLLKLLGGDSIGVVLVVDCTKPEQFPRAIEMLRKTETFGLPIVIAANKADLPGALSIDDIKNRLHLNNDVPITATVAEDLSRIDPNQPTKLKKSGVDEVLSTLFRLVIEEDLFK